MSFEVFKKVVDDIYRDSFMLLLWNQGEPFLNEEFCKMVEYASAKGMYLMTSTNVNFEMGSDPNSTLANNEIKSPLPPSDRHAGLSLQKGGVLAEDIINSGLDIMLVSLDGTTQETYNKYRINGDLSKVLENIRNLVLTKKALNKTYPLIVSQFLVMKHNEHEIEDFKRLSDELGADEYVFKTVQIYSKEDIYEYLPDNPKYRRYKITSGDFELKFGIKNRCYRIWNQPVVNWDGEMAVCCFDKDNEYKIGNVNEKSFYEIWKSDRFMMFRRNVLRKRMQYEICRNCGEGVSLGIRKSEV